jgi:glucose/arabinose dehydrogenase
MLLSVSQQAQNLTPVGVTVQTFYTGLSQPVGIYNCGDDRLFILEQNESDIEIINTSGQFIGKFLDLTGTTSTGGERGLLGMAFHPNYAENGYFFVNYTNTSGNTVIARYQVSANPNVANPSSATVIMTINQPYSNHNGGHIAFGPDGYLYIGMGDGGSGGDPQNYAQNKLSRLGKMLRIDVDSASPYAIPPSNPYVGNSQYLPEIWAIGLRNPWKFSFDRQTGDLWIGDVGQNTQEEIDFEPAGSAGGYNWGWRCYEGNVSHNTSGCQSQSNYNAPIMTYTHAASFCSITGGIVHRGNQQPALNGIYFHGDYCNAGLHAIRPNGSGGYTTTNMASTGGAVTAFGEDNNGELYFAKHNGSIMKINDSCPFYPSITSDDGTLTATTGTQYWWYKDDVLIAGENTSNYVPTASGSYYARVNNGSCTRQTNSVEWLVKGGEAGCTYAAATNYNPNAQVDDGSCVFNNCMCPADFNHDGVIGVTDLLMFIGLYGTTCD